MCKATASRWQASLLRCDWRKLPVYLSTRGICKASGTGPRWMRKQLWCCGPRRSRLQAAVVGVQLQQAMATALPLTGALTTAQAAFQLAGVSDDCSRVIRPC